jgi:hypothetical protein
MIADNLERLCDQAARQCDLLYRRREESPRLIRLYYRALKREGRRTATFGKWLLLQDELEVHDRAMTTQCS